MVLEALAMGTPVSRLPWVESPKSSSTSENGLLLDDASEEDLAQRSGPFAMNPDSLDD